MAKAQGDIRYLQGVFDSTSQQFLGISDPNTSGDGVDFSVPVYSDTQLEAGATGVAAVTNSGRAVMSNGQDVAFYCLTKSDDPTAAASNTAAIQQALLLGNSIVVGGGGIVWINDTLVQYANTSFKTVDNTTIKMVAGVNKKVLCNYALTTSATTVTLTYTNGSTSSMAWTGHDLDLGDCIVLQGSTTKDWDATARVIEVTDANNVVILLPWFPKAAPAGTITAKKCDRNIKTDVKIDYNYSGGNTTASALDRMGTVFAFISDSDINVSGFDIFKYVLMVAGADNVRGGGIGYPYSRSDTVKIYGPANNVQLYAEGLAPEDTASFQALEPAAFIWYMPCKGSIRNCEYHDLKGMATTAGSGALVVYSDDTYWQDGLKISGGDLVSTGPMSAFQIRPGTDFTGAQSLLKNVTLEDLTLTCKQTNTYCALVQSNIDQLVFKDVIFNPATVDLTSRWLRIMGGCEVDTLVIDGTNFDATGRYTSTGAYGVELSGANTARKVIFRNLKINGATFYRLFLANVTANCETVILENCDMVNMSSCFRTEMAGITVVIDGGTYTGSSICANFRASGTLIIKNSPTFVDMNLGVCRAENSATVDIYCVGAPPRLSGTSVLFTALTSGTVNIKSNLLSVDIGASGVNRVNGGRAFNTSARGTIPANKEVLCDGTAWYNATNLSQTY